MSTLRIVSDDDGTPWIEKKSPDGTWDRVKPSDEPSKFRVADLRNLNHSQVTEIADTIDHAQRKLATDILESHDKMAKSVIEALKPRFRITRDTPAEPSPTRTPNPIQVTSAALPASTFELPEIPTPPPDPTYELIAQIEEQNVILTEQRDDARKHAESTEGDAKVSRRLAWAAIGVTVAVGVTQIVLSIIELNS